MYPLAEAEVVSGFEAEAAGRRVSFQLQSRRRSQAACCRALGPGWGASTPRRCAQGECRAPGAPAPPPKASRTRIPAPALRPTPAGSPSSRWFLRSLIHGFIQQSWTRHLTRTGCWGNGTQA